MEKDRLEIFLYNALFTLYDTYTIDLGYDDESAFSKIKEETGMDNEDIEEIMGNPLTTEDVGEVDVAENAIDPDDILPPEEKVNFWVELTKAEEKGVTEITKTANYYVDAYATKCDEFIDFALALSHKVSEHKNKNPKFYELYKKMFELVDDYINNNFGAQYLTKYLTKLV